MDVYGDKKEKNAHAQWDKMKGLSLQEKFDYFVHYYGLISIGVIFGAAIIIGITVSIIKNNAPKIIIGDFYTDDVTEEAAEELKVKLCQKLGLQAEDEEIAIYSSLIDSSDMEALMYQGQRLEADIYSMTADFIAATEMQVSGYMNKDDLQDCPFLDLRELLSPELLKRLENQGRVIYFSTSFAGEMPYLIETKGSKLYQDMGLTSNSCTIGFLAKTEHKAAIQAFCELIAE